ncbi:hypothetical protein GLYMA_17G024550v4 [Glycine max]|nr:hypothetical protein GLYMA_17G024550v4 [Glycine max]KAH1116385.1 hypothetical protein GYH30_046019 [Glycine max]
MIASRMGSVLVLYFVLSLMGDKLQHVWWSESHKIIIFYFLEFL